MMSNRKGNKNRKIKIILSFILFVSLLGQKIPHLRAAPVRDESYSIQEQKEEKRLLRQSLAEDNQILEGINCVENEVVVSVSDREQAKVYATTIGGYVKKYEDGFAVIELSSDSGEGFTSVKEAVISSAEDESFLPPLWPNYYYYIDEYYINEYKEEKADPFLYRTNSSYQWHHEIINTKQAWAYGFKGQNVKVAVLDTGLQEGQEDVSACMLEINERYGSKDVLGHGTHVAALIGAVSGNGIGGAGIAPKAELISIKVMGDDGRGDSASIMSGIERAMEEGVHIINMSLGSASYSRPFEEKILKAYHRGIIVFGAAGNDGTNGEFYPASFEGAFSVAAIDKSRQRASFSNYGSSVRYSAPGVDLYSAYAGGVDRYALASGTSQATPLVSGIAAVILSTGQIKGDGFEKVDALIKILDKGCVKITGKGMGKGYIDLSKALGLAEPSGKPSPPVFSHKGGIYAGKEMTIYLKADPFSDIYYLINGKKIALKDGKLTEGAVKYDSEAGITVSGKTNRISALAVSRQNGLSSKVITCNFRLKDGIIDKSDQEIILTGKISISGNEAVVKGRHIYLNVIHEPENVSNKKVSWKVVSSDTKVKISQKGKLSADKKAVSGNCVVEVAALDGSGKKAYFNVKILEEGITDITVREDKIKLFRCGNLYGSPTAKEIEVLFSGNDDAGWTAKSNKEGIVTVEKTKKGILLKAMGKATGKAIITISSADGTNRKKKCTVTVDNPPGGLDIAPQEGRSKYLAQGKQLKLIPQFETSYGQVKYKASDLQWSSTSKDVTVDNKGRVTAHTANKNTVVISAQTTDGSNLKAEYKITTCLPVEKVELSNITEKVQHIMLGTAIGYKYDLKNKEGVSIASQGSGEITVTVNKKGLTPYFTKNSQGVKVIGVMANKQGRYKVTLSMKDGSRAKKTYIFQVW